MAYTYLDWAATALPDERALRVFERTAMDFPGNPSSVHAAGLKAAERLAEIRERFSRLIGCPASSIFFTGSGTESNNIVFSSLLLKSPQSGRKKTVVISAFEHASVHEPAQLLKTFGYEVTAVRPGQDGRIDVERFLSSVDETTVLASVMHVNNETGAIQPVEELARGLFDKSSHLGKKIHFHVDAVQSFGKLPFAVRGLPIDSASASAHKLGAPKGSGLLYLKSRIPVLYRGGGQESDIRPGTENLPGAAAFLASAETAFSSITERFNAAVRLRDYLFAGLSEIPGFTPLPGFTPEDYSPYIIPAFFPPVPGEVLARFLSDAGVAVSTGAACSGKKKGESRVLTAMGLSKAFAFSALRISTGFATDTKDIDNLLEALRLVLPELSTLGRNR